MIPRLYTILAILFLVGALATFQINKKHKSDSRKNWVKYFVYLIIVNVVFLTLIIDSRFFFYLALLLTMIGLVELLGAIKHWPFFVVLIAILFYSALSFGFLNFAQMDYKIICYTYFVVLVFDALSQLTGQLFGKTPLVPKISPGKTVEGFIGGMVLTMLVALSMNSVMHLNTLQSASYALIIGMFAFCGDLLASWIKRLSYIKDFGTPLPGHGGILDRFDSLLFSGAMVWVINTLTSLAQ